MPEPFKGKRFTTWALIHGTPAEGAQNILLEGFIRPAHWVYNPDHRRCDIPTFGGYYLGLEIGREDSIPEWAAPDLRDRSQERGKGQQQVLIGALYRGAKSHISFKAGGNERAQLNIPHCGIVTTLGKHTIPHSKHVGLCFFALKWQKLPSEEETESDDVTYRGRRHRSPQPAETPSGTIDHTATANP